MLKVFACSEALNGVTATEKSDRLQRCLAWVQDCKRAVTELRSEVKAAISNREKCCMVLSAAMAASLALESVRHPSHLHPACHLAKPNQLLMQAPVACDKNLLAFTPYLSVGLACCLLCIHAICTSEQCQEYILTAAGVFWQSGRHERAAVAAAVCQSHVYCGPGRCSRQGSFPHL